MTLGLVRREQGDYAQATVAYEKCLALHRTSGERGGVAVGLLGLGDIARDRGNTAHVCVFCEESLAIFKELGEHWGVGFSLNNLALAAYMEGELTRAATLGAESVALFRGLKAESSLAEVLLTTGRIHAAQGAAAAARNDIAAALRLASGAGPRWLVAASLEALAGLSMQQGLARHAARLLGAATALRAAMGAPVPPYCRPEIEATSSAARTSLGAEAFTAAWNEGESMPVEQTLIDALPKEHSLQAETRGHW
jgi:tetratricopeptide (TPR) repeat protein